LDACNVAYRLRFAIPKFRYSEGLNHKPNPTNRANPIPNCNPNLRNSGPVPGYHIKVKR